MTPDTKNRLDVINQKPKVIKKGYRRNADDAYQEYDYGETTTSWRDLGFVFKSHTNESRVASTTNKQHSIHKNQNRFDVSSKMLLTKRNFSFTPSMKNLKTEKYQSVGIPKFVKKNKIQNFKQFMKKNEGLFKNFVSDKIAAQTQIKTTNVLRQMIKNKNNNELFKSKPLSNGVKEIQRTENNDDEELPSPELLDMAPAKGGRIHKQREKVWEIKR